VGRARGQQHEFLEPDEYGAWNALLTLTQSVLRDVDTALRKDAGISVSEFDVLITLFNAPDRRLGMTALANQVMLSPSGLTHLVTRMERDGLLAREVDADDRRKFYAVLTDAGDEKLAAARRTHNATLRRTLLPHLSPGHRRTLMTVGSAVTAPSADPQRRRR
jgi:DNA-binding MarR family transcriptional regulator